MTRCLQFVGQSLIELCRGGAELVRRVAVGLESGMMARLQVRWRARANGRTQSVKFFSRKRVLAQGQQLLRGLLCLLKTDLHAQPLPCGRDCLWRIDASQ